MSVCTIGDCAHEGILILHNAPLCCNVFEWHWAPYIDKMPELVIIYFVRYYVLGLYCMYNTGYKYCSNLTSRQPMIIWVGTLTFHVSCYPIVAQAMVYEEPALCVAYIRMSEWLLADLGDKKCAVAGIASWDSYISHKLSPHCSSSHGPWRACTMCSLH